MRQKLPLNTESNHKKVFLFVDVPEPPGGTRGGVGRDAAVLRLEPLKRNIKNVSPVGHSVLNPSNQNLVLTVSSR